jgi:hypothetical protein
MSEPSANGTGTTGLNGISDRTRAKWAAGSPEDIAARLPPMLDLTIENITENVMQINSMCDNPRMMYLITKLVKASHDYVRDVNLQFDEWEQAWQFLTRVSITFSIKKTKINIQIGRSDFNRCPPRVCSPV